MWIEKIKAFLSRARTTLPGRWFWLLAGLGLIVYGQTFMHLREPVGEINQTLELLNTTFRLEIVNMQNFGTAIPLLLTGGLLCALAFNLNWSQDENRTIEKTQRGEEIIRGNRWHSAGMLHEGRSLEENRGNRLERVEQVGEWAYFLPRLLAAFLLFAYLIFKLGRHEHTPILPWIWMLALALFTYLVYRFDKANKTNLSLNITRADILWLAFLFLAGLAIGSFSLQDIPKIMVPDEGSFWEAGRAIATGELKPEFFGFGVYTFPMASSIFQNWIMRLAGVGMWGWRFASVLAGTLTSIPLYLLAREWYDRRVAVLSVLIMVTSPYFLSFTRIGYNNSQALFPVVLSLYFWSLSYKRGSNLYTWLAGLASGLGFYTYPAAWLGLATIIAVTVLLALLRRVNFRRALISTAIILVAAAVTASPRLVYGASSESAEPLFFKLAETSFVNVFYGSVYYGPAELYPDGMAYQLGSSLLFYAPDVYFELLTRGVVRTLAALFDPFIVSEHFITTNLSGGFLRAIGLVLGLGLSLRGVKWTSSLLILTWLGGGLFFLSIIAAFPPRHTHLVTIIPALALLSALGYLATIDTLAEGLLSKWPPARFDWMRKGVLILLGGTLVIFGFQEYFITMPLRNPPQFEDIASWIAWRTDEPLTIVYIGNTGSPHRVQYLVNTHMVSHKYISVGQDDFKWQNVPAKSVVFFDGQPDGKNTFIPTPPSTFNNSTTCTNLNNEIIGYIWTDTGIELQPTAPFPFAREEAPVKIITIFSALAIIGVLLMFFQIRVTFERTTDKPGFRVSVDLTLRRTSQNEVDEEL